MQYRILGPLEVLDHDEPLRLGGPKQRAVLAHLILRPNRVVSADLLIDELWGEEPPETARNTLQTYVYRLRKALGDASIEARAGGYVLHVEPAEIDASRFEALVKEAKLAVPSDPAAAALDLDEALGMWRGGALADLAEEPSLRGEIARLEELRLSATEHRLSAELAAGRHSTMISELEALTSRFPLRERLWAHLMRALYLSGRQAEALDVYRRAREVLAEELGTDPSAELQRLHQQILGRDPGLQDLPVPAPAPVPVPAPQPAAAQPAARSLSGDLSPGTEFAGYRIEGILGRGGMSVVYLAEHLGLGRKVALKLLAPQLADDERFRERFVRESRVAAGMEHANIVPIYEAGEAEGFLFIAMRYVPGTDLGKLIRRVGMLEPARAEWIIREAASALDAAHAKGLVHRDVKPGNILVVEGEGSEGRDLVYLSDFGLTKRLESGTGGLTQTGQFVGTVDYVAPEQIEGKSVDARADVYSLGCVLFECLTGRVPYERDTQVAALFAHLQEKPPRPSAARPDLPVSLDEVVAKALSKSAAGRYATCGGFATAVRDALAPPREERAAAGVFPRRASSQMAIGAIGAALVAGVIIFSISRGETPAGEAAGSTPTPSATPSPTPEPNFRTVDRPLAADEERLLTYVPEDVGSDCLPLDREPIRELAGLVCRSGGVEVLYELFASRDSMDAAFQTNANINRAPDGECATDELAVGTYTIGDEPAGRVLCYTVTTRAGDLFAGLEHSSHIEWTDERLFVYAHAIRQDVGDLTLYDWWRSSAGPVASADGDAATRKDPPAAAEPRLRDGSYLLSITQRQAARIGQDLGTYGLHIEGGAYELASEGTVVESGTTLLKKPNAIVFTLESGVCNLGEVGPATASATYEWSASGDSLTWERQGSGTCAGPQVLGRFIWTRAPNGTIAFEREGQISLMDVGGFGVEEITTETTTFPNGTPVWSPDGTKIAFAGADPEGFDIYVMNADGTDITRLTDGPGDEGQPAWSPDGSRIAFAFDDHGDPVRRSGVAVVGIDGNGWTELAAWNSVSAYRPAWSPDGDRIALSVLIQGETVDTHELYVMDADGGDLSMIHEERGEVLLGAPMTWTPDGRRIVFWGASAGKGTLLSMLPDGSNVREFVDPFPRSIHRYVGELVLDWSPDRRWIVIGGIRPPGLQTDGTYGNLVLLMPAGGSEIFTIGTYVNEPRWRPTATG